MLIRFRSREGNFRLEFNENDSFQSLLDTVSQKVNVPDLCLSRDPAGKEMIQPSGTLSELGIKHGDLLHLIYSAPKKPEINIPTPSFVVEEQVDQILDKKDGLIKRQKDTNFCKHTANGMCDYCMPLEPYDAGYLEEKGIKHLSFHSYLRQIYPKHKKGSSSFQTYSAPLEELNFKVNVNCLGGHAPWPEGICTKCQPSAITLQRQTFRFVDHVEFASATVVDNFIRYWRASGTQRFGYLLGRYEVYDEVPLGIKAVVEAIYEPPQENFVDELQVDFSEESECQLRAAAELVNLKILGMVYTDLFDKGQGNGKVLCKRHVNSYFISAQECTFSAQMQSKYPNACRYSKSGKFGSKFVTCIVTGNLEGDIDISAYQISMTGESLMDADLIQPSVQPSKMLVCEETKDRYIPEIFYKFKNEYGVNVKQNASPSFPVEYLIVNVTHGFPSRPNPLFISTENFPVENRITELADMGILKKHLNGANLSSVLSDFHLLLFLKSCGILSPEELNLAVQIATLHSQIDFDCASLITQLTQSSGWMTLMTIFEEYQGQETSTSSNPIQGASTSFQCRHCTFVNSGENPECEMCGLPQD